MGKLTKIFSLILITINFAACGGGSSSSKGGDGRSISVTGDGNSVYYNGGFFPAEFMNANGQIADPQAFCTYVWDNQYDRAIEGLVESHRHSSGGQTDYIITNETLSKTADSITTRFTMDFGDGMVNTSTRTTTRNQSIQDCVDSFNNPDNVDPNDPTQFSMRMEILAQRTESVTVQAGTYTADYVEYRGSLTVESEDGTMTMNMSGRSWTGKEGLAQGRIIKMESTGSMNFNGMNLPSDFVIELIELYVR